MCINIKMTTHQQSVCFNLRVRLTLCGKPLQRKPWSFGDNVYEQTKSIKFCLFTLFYATHASIVTFDFSKSFYNNSSQKYKAFRYHKKIYSFGI